MILTCAHGSIGTAMLRSPALSRRCPAARLMDRSPSSCAYRAQGSRTRCARSTGGECWANEWRGAGSRLPRSLGRERQARFDQSRPSYGGVNYFGLYAMIGAEAAASSLLARSRPSVASLICANVNFTTGSKVRAFSPCCLCLWWR